MLLITISVFLWLVIDHFSEFRQGFLWLWFVVSRLVVVSMYVLETSLKEVIYGRFYPPM